MPAPTLEQLRDRVKGRSLTCQACGARRPCLQWHVVPDRVRNLEHTYGVCTDCSLSLRMGALRSAVAREILNLDPDDEVLGHITAQAVPLFIDEPGRVPERPNANPWQHVNHDRLAKWVADWRQDRDSRRGGPCAWCGMPVTPQGTSWRTMSLNGRSRATCGSCFGHIGHLGTGSADARDLAAARIVGLTRRTHVVTPRDLGGLLGVEWWHETGAKHPNKTPFAHLDLRAIRAEMQRLVESRIVNVPAWWTPDRRGSW